MRDYKGMKRQRGRNRQGGGGQGGGKPGQNANRAFDSQGPENIKVRGGAQHVYEKYNQLARDATSSGDRVLAENHLQHAEHYFRTLRVLQPNRPVTEIVGRDTFVNGFDLDFEDEALESAMAAADAAATQPQSQAPGDGEPPAEAQGSSERFERGDRQGQDGQRREFRDRGERQGGQNQGGQAGGYDRQDRGDRARYENRRDRWEDRGERQGGQNQGGQNQGGQNQPQASAPSQGGERAYDRERQERGDRSRYETRRDRWENREPPAAQAVDTPTMVAPESAAPPRATFEPESADASRMLRSEDGGVSEAPAFLSAAPAAAADDDGRRTRTRRPRRRTGEDEGSSQPETTSDEG